MNQIEQRVKAVQARVKHLRLAKAFSGELTADWCVQNYEFIIGDNSAAALLVIIKAEREQTQVVKKSRK